MPCKIERGFYLVNAIMRLDHEVNMSVIEDELVGNHILMDKHKYEALMDKVKSMMTAMVSEELNRSNPPPEVISTAIVLMNKKKNEKKK